MFARATGADLGEAEHDLGAYESLGDLFARRLRPGARSIDGDARAVVSPCDGVVAAVGHADAGELVQAKGHRYTLGELLVDDALAAQLIGGAYVTIYLSPRDYHRVHTPIDGALVGYDYVPGALWPVNPRVVDRRARLLSRNERVVFALDGGALGPVALVMVGAAGVGNIRLAHLPQASADSRSWRPLAERRHIEHHADVARGDELGAFRLGSTVVLVFAPGAVSIDVAVGDRVEMGRRIGTRGGRS